METLVRLIGPEARALSAAVEGRFRERMAATSYPIPEDPSIYGVYPYLFTSLAEELAPEVLLDLAYFCRAYAAYSIWMDKLMDRQVEPNPALLLAVGRSHEESLLCLTRLTQQVPALWSSFATYREENHRILLVEASLTLQQIPSIPLTLFEAIGAGKVAIAKICPVALAHFAGKAELVGRLERMHDAQAQGMQLADDVQDWKEDLKAGRPSYPLALFFREHPELLQEQPDSWARVRSAVLLSDHFDWALSLAQERFLASLSEAHALGCTGWARLVQLNLSRVEGFRQELDHLRGQIRSARRAPQMQG